MPTLFQPQNDMNVNMLLHSLWMNPLLILGYSSTWVFWHQSVLVPVQHSHLLISSHPGFYTFRWLGRCVTGFSQTSQAKCRLHRSHWCFPYLVLPWWHLWYTGHGSLQQQIKAGDCWCKGACSVLTKIYCILIFNSQNLKFKFNAQHDCQSAGCSMTGSHVIQQERQKSGQSKSVILHIRTFTNCYFLNMFAFHNAHLLQAALPHDLIRPIPICEDCKGLHSRLAANLQAKKAAKPPRKQKVTQWKPLSPTQNAVDWITARSLLL